MSEALRRHHVADFYHRHWRPLWAYAVRMGADPASAQDIAQNAFLAWSTSPAVQWDEPRAKAYLYTCARHGVIDRARLTHREQSLEAVPEPIDEAQPADPSFGARWERLPPRDRQLLWLAYAEGFAHAEIAKIVGAGTSSIKVLLSRARERAQKLLGRSEDPDVTR